jgi:hypothetical protein
MHSSKTFLLGVLCSLGLPSMLWGQATINENLETAFVYVDTVNGSDSNPGTVTSPLKTIGAAVSMAETNNQNSVGTKVIINPGTYREAVTVSGSHKTTSLPITFQAAINGTVTVSGADVWTGWEPYSGNSSIYTNSWPYSWGLCAASTTGPPQADVVLRREMVFVNGTLLTEVLSLSEMAAGTFYVDESGGTIYIWPPVGTNLETATVEVSTRPQAWTIQNQSYLVARGLTFQDANPCWADGAVVVQGSSSNILFDSDNFNWNSAEGLQLWNGTTYYTVQNSVAEHNGESGFAAYEVKYGLFQSDVSAFNNWRGAQGAYYGWNASGFHFTGDHTDTLTNIQTYYNQTQGVHYDTDNENITINGLASNNDLNVGLFFEVTQGPVTVSGASVCAGSTLASTAFTAFGMRDSEFITVSGSNFVNAPFDLGVVETPGGTWVTNWETGQQELLFTQNFSLTNSVVEAGSGQELFSVGTLVNSEWSDFQTSLSSNHNTWWDASNNSAFLVPVPATNTAVNFSSWQATTGQDQQSVFQAPSGNPAAACTGAPDMTDYWFLVPLNEDVLTVNPGFAAVWNASVFPLLGFNATVQLSSDGVQNIPNATASWSATSVAAGGTANFTLTPGSNTPSGTYPVTLIANSGSLTHTVTVFVTVDTSVKVTPQSVSFGNQKTKTSSNPKPVTVINKESAPLTIDSFSFRGPNSRDFTQTNNCPSSLASGASCTINVTFTPGATGSRSATMKIADSDAASPQQISLTGTGT